MSYLCLLAFKITALSSTNAEKAAGIADNKAFRGMVVWYNGLII